MSTVLNLSDSQAKNFARCQRRWAYEKLMRVSPEEDKDNLTFGSGLHLGLESYVAHRDLVRSQTLMMESIKKGKPSDEQWQLQVAPAMLYGWCVHWLPGFEKDYEFVKLEAPFEFRPHEQLLHRGMLDVIARRRVDGKIAIFDYKSTGSSGGGDLGKSVSSNRQLGIYAMAWRRISGEWPAEVALVFLQKPKNKEIRDAVQNAKTNSDLYYTRSAQVTPAFAAFAMDVERSDVLVGQQMLHYRALVEQQGLPAFEHIPANYNECMAYGSMCGFAKGCHSGNPLHRTLKALPPK